MRLLFVLCWQTTDPSFCGNLEPAFILSIVSLMSTTKLPIETDKDELTPD